LKTAAYEVDEYRVMAGWPVAVPQFEIRAICEVSADGEIVTARDDNTSISTGALIRWVADDLYFDQTALLWNPVQDGTGTKPVWTSTVAYMPVLVDDFTYRVKDEVFTQNAVNFDSDTKNHMWADFTATIGGGAGYTVIMAMSPNSAFGNDIDVPYNGLWCPGRPTPDAEDTFTDDIGATWMATTIQGGYLYLSTESRDPTRAISIQPGLNSNAPLYIAMVYARPTMYYYVGNGPSSIRVKTLEVGPDPGIMDDFVVLGRSTGDVLHTADMALFDLGIYADILTAEEVSNEFALLSGVYGGDT
jgi:hypothetical protein